MKTLNEDKEIRRNVNITFNKDYEKDEKFNTYENRLAYTYTMAVGSYNSLCALLCEWDEGVLDFTPPCPREVYEAEAKCLFDYLLVLEKRMKIEKIDLKNIK